MKRWLRQIALQGLLLGVFVLGCSPRTTLRIMKPAAVDVSGIQRLAVLDFSGEDNSGLVVTSLFTSKLWQTGFYTLVERSELERILQEHALNLSGVVDASTAAQVGKMLGVDAVLLGEVLTYTTEDHTRTRKVKKKVWTGEYERDKNGNIIYEKTLFGGKVKKKKYREVLVNQKLLERDATVSVSFRLVDVETGKIRATKIQTHSTKATVVSGEGDLPTAEEMLHGLLEQCVDEFVSLLTPHFVEIQARFARSDEAVNRGIELAKNGLWDKAQAVWEAVVRENPQNHAAWYNLGLAYEAQGRFGRAVRAYNQAVNLKAKKMYMKALQRARQEVADQKRLQEQLQHRGEPAAESEGGSEQP